MRAWLACLLLLPACNTLPDLRRDYPEQAFHLLQVQRPSPAEDDPPPAAPLAASLTVGMFDAAPACDDTSFVYRLDAHEYQADYYERFFVHPAAHLADLTRQWLHDGGRFQAVVPDTSRLPTTHRLDGLVQELHADYQDPDAPFAVLTLQCFLTTRADDGLPNAARALSWQVDLHQTVPLSDSTPQALAAAWSQALQLALVQLEEGLVQALAGDA